MHSTATYMRCIFPVSCKGTCSRKQGKGACPCKAAGKESSVHSLFVHVGRKGLARIKFVNEMVYTVLPLFYY